MHADLPILLVEDHPAVGSVLARHLAAEGYSLVHATSAVEAVRLIEHDRYQFALAVVDFVLPAPGSSEVIDALRATMNPLRVLLMSALPDDTVRESPSVAAIRSQPNFRFMEKPFSLDSFSACVAELLRDDDAFSARAGEHVLPS